MNKRTGIRKNLTGDQEIDYVFLFKGYTILVMHNGSNEVIDLPLATVESILADRNFFRIHRSYLVNLGRIRELRISENRLLVRMRGHELPVSRRKKRQLLEMLGATG